MEPSDNESASEAVKKLLADLYALQESPEIADSITDRSEPHNELPTGIDEEMLTIVVNDAWKGVDVKEKYPDFYRKLLANAPLRQAFLDALEALDASGGSDALPPMPDSDFSFLDQDPPPSSQ